MSKEDYLKIDPEINGQEYVVISILNPPADILVKKNLYYMNHFMVQDINKMILAQGIQTIKFIKSENRKKVEDVLNLLKASVDEDDKRVYEILSKRFKDLDL